MSKKQKRIVINTVSSHVGEEIEVSGWVHARRDHGKLVFIDLIDRTGLLQIVFHPEKSQDSYQLSLTLRTQDVITIKGMVNNRPEKLINPKIISGTVELVAAEVTILSKADTLPFDMGVEQLNLELPTLLDYRSLTLRHDKVRKIFLVQATIAEAFRKAAEALSCVEIFVPTIAAGATEGGAEVFKLDYFGHEAFMTQSPQLYKQIMVSVFERVYTIAKAYRAEPSVTTRHLTEATQMDIEVGFINDFDELLDMLEFVGTSMVNQVAQSHENILNEFEVNKPLVPNVVPRLTLRQAQQIITERTGRNLQNELDLNPEDEREICLWAKEVHKSDFVTITHFPTAKRAFYTMPDPKDPEYSLSYDLLFRGIEILSGSQRVHDYGQLIKIMKTKKVDPETFGIYLMAFKYGMPPEGGFSFGLERLTMKLLELQNIREASLFPRDMERVDERFSIVEEKTKKAILQKKAN